MRLVGAYNFKTGGVFAAAGGAPPFRGCHVKGSSTTASNGGDTTLSWAVANEMFDEGGYHTAAALPSFVIPAGEAGKYLIFAHIHFAPDADGERYMRLIGGGGSTMVESRSVGHATVGTPMEVMWVGDAVVGTAFNIQVTQDSGQGLSVGAGDLSGFFIVKLSAA